MPAHPSRNLAITGATIIDGSGREPISDAVLLVEDGRISSILGCGEIPTNFERISAQGKYVIPGLMNANVHLMGAITVERMIRHLDELELIVVEAAQIALKNGITTVFDTCGPRRPLTSARDKIASGETIGSRIFCAGWIVGFDGLFSDDFQSKAEEVVSSTLVAKINAMCAENVGRHLMWLPPDQVGQNVCKYIGSGIDFVKYASNEHFAASAGAFLTFSPEAQRAIVKAAHQSGITAQAHTMSVEGLRIAIEAGCDLIQHANITGPEKIPNATLELIAERGVALVVFPWTDSGLAWLMQNVSKTMRTSLLASDSNVKNLIRTGAPLLMANDGMVLPPEWHSDPKYASSWSSAPDKENLAPLASGHFAWLRAMEEKQYPPMSILQAATRNVAIAYGKDKDLGTLEPGKIADMLILSRNPLESAMNYQTIEAVFKEGIAIDRLALPEVPVLTAPEDLKSEEEERYVPFLRDARAMPMCPSCMGHW